MNAATLECPVSYQHSRFVEKWVQRETAPSPPAEQRQFTSSAGPTDLRVGDARTGKCSLLLGFVHVSIFYNE